VKNQKLDFRLNLLKPLKNLRSEEVNSLKSKLD